MLCTYKYYSIQWSNNDALQMYCNYTLYHVTTGMKQHCLCSLFISSSCEKIIILEQKNTILTSKLKIVHRESTITQKYMIDARL